MRFAFHTLLTFLTETVYIVKILFAQIFCDNFVQNRMKDFGGFVLKKTITCVIIYCEVYIGDLCMVKHNAPCIIRRTA